MRALIPQPTPQYGQVVVTVRTGLDTSALGVIAPVGQDARHEPQVVQTDSTSGLSMNVPMRASVPAPSTSIAPMNWCPSWHAWAQRPHIMQESIAIWKTGFEASTTSRSRPVHRGLSMP